MLEFIASKIETHPRAEGALIRVSAFANVNRQEVDMTLGRDRAQGPHPEGGEPEITAGLIIARTAAYFGVSIEELTNPPRPAPGDGPPDRDEPLPRAHRPVPAEDRRSIGSRDHTTVMYADRKINQLLAERRAVFNQVSELTSRVKAAARQT